MTTGSRGVARGTSRRVAPRRGWARRAACRAWARSPIASRGPAPPRSGLAAGLRVSPPRRPGPPPSGPIAGRWSRAGGRTSTTSAGSPMRCRRRRWSRPGSTTSSSGPTSARRRSSRRVCRRTSRPHCNCSPAPTSPTTRASSRTCARSRPRRDRPAGSPAWSSGPIWRTAVVTRAIPGARGSPPMSGASTCSTARTPRSPPVPTIPGDLDMTNRPTDRRVATRTTVEHLSTAERSAVGRAARSRPPHSPSLHSVQAPGVSGAARAGPAADADGA